MESKKILVVDDEPHILFILEKELLKHGCIIQKAENGDEAIKHLNSDNYDIVILDLMMPGLSGLDVCQHIRKNPKTQNKPVIILTADHDERDKEKCLNMGIDDYITKPFSPRSLAERISEILKKYAN